jgi:hypothetical protein
MLDWDILTHLLYTGWRQIRALWQAWSSFDDRWPASLHPIMQPIVYASCTLVLSLIVIGMSSTYSVYKVSTGVESFEYSNTDAWASDFVGSTSIGNHRMVGLLCIDYLLHPFKLPLSITTLCEQRTFYQRLLYGPRDWFWRYDRSSWPWWSVRPHMAGNGDLGCPRHHGEFGYQCKLQASVYSF